MWQKVICFSCARSITLELTNQRNWPSLPMSRSFWWKPLVRSNPMWLCPSRKRYLYLFCAYNKVPYVIWKPSEVPPYFVSLIHHSFTDIQSLLFSYFPGERKQREGAVREASAGRAVQNIHGLWLLLLQSYLWPDKQCSETRRLGKDKPTSVETGLWINLS